jgi:hypothetical protein
MVQVLPAVLCSLGSIIAERHRSFQFYSAPTVQKVEGRFQLALSIPIAST